MVDRRATIVERASSLPAPLQIRCTCLDMSSQVGSEYLQSVVRFLMRETLGVTMDIMLRLTLEVFCNGSASDGMWAHLRYSLIIPTMGSSGGPGHREQDRRSPTVLGLYNIIR